MSESVHNQGKTLSNADRDKTVESHRDSLSLQQTVEFSENEALGPDIDLGNKSTFQHDRYEDLNLLGIGSTGMVRRVFDKRLKRQAAMKILHQEHVSNPHIVKRFISEAQGTAQLQHPGTVAVYDLDNFEDGRWFFTMQEVQGKTLQDAIENFFSSNRTWRFYDLIDAFHKVCVTIVYAHAKGVLHRDLKPENIMLGPFQEVVILDWGVAKFVRPSNVKEARIYTHKSQTMYGSVIGTPAYMAPEQARGELHTAQSDVFSLGTILYEILAGHPPYQGENLSEILEKAKNVSYTILKSQNPKRQYLIDVAEHAMQQDPKSRIKSAIELEKLLRSWLEGEQGREAARESILEADVLWLDIIKQNDKRSLYEEKLRDITEPRYKWQLEDELYQLELNIESQYTQYKQLLQKALTHYPNHEDARERLVMRYKSQHQRAEREKNDRGAIASAMQLQIHAAALPTNSSTKKSVLRYLKGHGTLSLQTNLCDVNVFLSAYVKNGRRLQLESEQHIGRAPLEKYPIAMGSYQIRLTKDGYQDTILPVYVEREQDWCALKPARLFPLGTLSAETIYVPAGSYLSGGDPNAVLGWPRKERFIDDFFIRKYPVTNAEYLRFLNAL
ncbi:MAG: bifunctional serine/threonine-protein kinase/formylglycine-generating enzyme family protein, partial [Myxococcota bacterium]|nr:bifunctional serine/threonine-protein kinase/formylglycine-generating enzyme family protein [Myxococcota bacterium]